MTSDAKNYHTKQLADDCTMIMYSLDDCFASLVNYAKICKHLENLQTVQSLQILFLKSQQYHVTWP